VIRGKFFPFPTISYIWCCPSKNEKGWLGIFNVIAFALRRLIVPFRCSTDSTGYGLWRHTIRNVIGYHVRDAALMATSVSRRRRAYTNIPVIIQSLLAVLCRFLSCRCCFGVFVWSPTISAHSVLTPTLWNHSRNNGRRYSPTGYIPLSNLTKFCYMVLFHRPFFISIDRKNQ